MRKFSPREAPGGLWRLGNMPRPRDNSCPGKPPEALHHAKTSARGGLWGPGAMPRNDATQTTPSKTTPRNETAQRTPCKRRRAHGVISNNTTERHHAPKPHKTCNKPTRTRAGGNMSRTILSLTAGLPPHSLRPLAAGSSW
eukprot:4236456-Pyramimonas_sp.AAC.2